MVRFARLALLTTVLSSVKASVAPPRSLGAAHTAADADGDGVLTQGELVALLHASWHHSTNVAIAGMSRDDAKFFLAPSFEGGNSGNGGATLEDLKAHSGDLHLARFASADADADGVVSSAELKSHMWEVMAAAGAPGKLSKPALLADVRALFSLADRDGDGKLSLTELLEVPEASLGGSIASLLSLGSAEKGAVEAAKTAAAEKAAAAALATEQARVAAAEKAAEKAEAAARVAEAKVLEAGEDDGAAEATPELTVEQGMEQDAEFEANV